MGDEVEVVDKEEVRNSWTAGEVLAGFLLALSLLLLPLARGS